MKKEDAQTLAGLCLPVSVFLVFLTLKLMSVVDWAWIWIISPLWGFVGFIMVLSILYAIVFSIRYRRFLKK